MPVRVSVCSNFGPRKGQPQAALVAKDYGTLLCAAANKLRLKKKDFGRARTYIWGTGAELPREGGFDGKLNNDDIVAISLGEPYAGPVHRTILPMNPALWLRWETRGEQLAVVEWSDTRTMNDALGRVSTLLEHPTFCAHENGAVVTHAKQRALPSSSYLGHNVYTDILCEFEQLAPNLSDSEAGFLAVWRSHNAPAVVVSYVAGAASTLRHELCHARFALDHTYRERCMAAWRPHAVRLCKWMRDLGYDSRRHADEFGAYTLTEPLAFWRGRLSAEEATELRAALVGGEPEPRAHDDTPWGVQERSDVPPTTDLTHWFGGFALGPAPQAATC